MTIDQNHIGCDIAKRVIDVFDRRSGRHLRLANERPALEAFAATLDPDRDRVVMEATGVHDRLLRHALAARGVAHVRLNPTTARRYAQARGRLAKTDRIDARSLAEFGATLRLAADPAPCSHRERLAALARRRDQLVETRAVETRHLADAFDPTVAADIEAMIAALTQRIEAIEAAIATDLKTDASLARHTELLVSAPGVGPVTALTLIAHMPELGQMTPKAAAALAGLAPFNDDSGQRPRPARHRRRTATSAQGPLYGGARSYPRQRSLQNLLSTARDALRLEKTRHHRRRQKASRRPQRHAARRQGIRVKTQLPVDDGAEHVAEAGNDDQPEWRMAAQQQRGENGLRLRRQDRRRDEGAGEEADIGAKRLHPSAAAAHQRDIGNGESGEQKPHVTSFRRLYFCLVAPSGGGNVKRDA